MNIRVTYIEVPEDEKIIKSKKRVKEHGEVFTPKRIVHEMINLSELKETIQEFKTTVLEPACGEGVFLVEILKKRLKKARKESEWDLTIYENLALLALSTLYGIEILEDNVSKCVMNINDVFKDYYREYIDILKKKKEKNELPKNVKQTIKESHSVLESAKTIIAANIISGNFLTHLSNSGEPIIFTEWRIVPCDRNKHIEIKRLEFTFDEVLSNSEGAGKLRKNIPYKIEQPSLFESLDFDIVPEVKEYRYKTVPLNQVYLEEIEEVPEKEELSE